MTVQIVPNNTLMELNALCPYCLINLSTDHQAIFCTNCHHQITNVDCSCYECSKKQKPQEKAMEFFNNIAYVPITEEHRALLLLLFEVLPCNDGVFQFHNLFEKPLFFRNRIVIEKFLLGPLLQQFVFLPLAPYRGIKLYKDEYLKIDYQVASFRLNVTNLVTDKVFDEQTKQYINTLFETDYLLSSFTRHFDNLAIPYDIEVLLRKVHQLLISHRPYLHWDDFTNGILSTISDLERLLGRCQLDRKQAFDVALMDFSRVLEFKKSQKPYGITEPTNTEHFATTKGIEVWCTQFLDMNITDFFNRTPTKHF